MKTSLTFCIVLLLAACGSVSDQGVDADTSSIDAATFDAATQCMGARSCVAAPPPGWSGPVLYYEGPASTVAPSCPAAYPTNQDSFQTLTAGGSCDCQCSAATSVGCGAVTARRNGTTTCNSFFDSLGIFPPDSCQTVTISPTKNFIAVGLPPVSGGSCVATALDSLDTPSFQTVSRTCGGASAPVADCSAGDVCAPDPTAGFQTQLCISMPGNVACPSGSAYNQQIVMFSGFTDDRICGSCGCGNPTGNCPGKITFIDDCNAGLPIFYADVATSSCAAVSSQARGGTFRPDPNPTGVCAPTAGTIQNTANPTGPTTVCCLP